MNDETEPKAAKADKGPALTRKALTERVQAATGAKMKDVKTIVEATLAVMGDSLKAGEAMRLPPFGMGRPKKPKEGSEGLAPKMMLKASTKEAAPKPPRTPKEPKQPKGGRAAGAGRAAKGKRAGKKAKGVETPTASD
jgi:nucleoid DNA-binding protein